MNLNWNIEYSANQVIMWDRIGLRLRKALGSFTEKLSLTRYINSILQKNDAFILTLEGLQKHIPELSSNEVLWHLENTRRALRMFDKLDDKCNSEDYFGFPELKKRIRLTLKTLSRLESLLHIAATKSIPVEKTSEDIKKGVFYMSHQAVSKSLN